MTKVILVAIDLEHPDSAKIALEEAAVLAKAKGLPLHVCYVLAFGFYSYIQPLISEDTIEALSKETHKKLDAFVAGIGIKAESHVLQGGVYQQILLLAEKLNADTVVAMARRPGAKITQLGPVAAQLMRYAECSVSVIR